MTRSGLAAAPAEAVSRFLRKGESEFLAAVLVLFSVRFSNTLINPSFPLVVEVIRGTKANLNSVTGSIIASGAVAGAFSATILGQFGDRWGHKRILIGCALGSAAASIAHVFAMTVTNLTLVRILFGFAIAGMMPAANVLIRSFAGEDDVGKAFGAATSMSTVGIALGPFVGGYVARTMGLRIPFVLTGIGQLVVVILVMLFIKSDSSRLN